MMDHQPPATIEPYAIWRESNPDPSLAEYRQRFDAVADALERFRESGWWQPPWLLEEVGINYRRA